MEFWREFVSTSTIKIPTPQEFSRIISPVVTGTEGMELWDQGLSRSPSNPGPKLWIHPNFLGNGGEKKALKENKFEGIPSPELYLRRSGLSTGRTYGMPQGFSNFPLKKVVHRTRFSWNGFHTFPGGVMSNQPHTRHSCIFQKPGIPRNTFLKLFRIIWDNPII